MFWLAVVATPPLLSGEVRAEDVALRQPNWPRARDAARQFASSNQFELPVLFYVLTILAIITKHADFLFVVMAWIFVLSRLAHAFVHVTSNNLELRGPILRHRRAGAGDHVADLHRPHHARAAVMTPGARLAAAIEVLADIGARRRPAADTLKDWGLSHRFAGSGDRAGIAGLVYDALRRSASSAFLMGEDTPRAVAARHAGPRARPRRRRRRAARRAARAMRRRR